MYYKILQTKRTAYCIPGPLIFIMTNTYCAQSTVRDYFSADMV